MGWNSWNYFGHKVDDKVIRQTATARRHRMKDAGYIYVNIDDTWEGTRDANGLLHTNSKFPDMKSLADYVHSRASRLESTPRRFQTCGGFEGSLAMRAGRSALCLLGIDYLKYDLCSFDTT